MLGKDFDFSQNRYQNSLQVFTKVYIFSIFELSNICKPILLFESIPGLSILFPNVFVSS